MMAMGMLWQFICTVLNTFSIQGTLPLLTVIYSAVVIPRLKSLGEGKESSKGIVASAAAAVKDPNLHHIIIIIIRYT